jgi:mRNA-degrading endonuclease toxin of MazEF toxin-antitoxin module
VDKWDIWTLSQNDARELTDPTQPLDESKDIRAYVVMSPRAILRAGARTVVCFPLQTFGNGTSSCIEIPGGKNHTSGLHKPVSHCWVSTPYTLPKTSFVKKIGYVHPNEQRKITFAVQEFFQIMP